MHDEAPARRPRVAAVIGIVVGVVFLGLGVMAFLAGGGPVVGIIAGAGGLLTIAASVFVLARP